MNALVDPAGEAVVRLATTALQVTLLLLSAGLLTMFLARSAAALRHLVWAVALGAALLLPVVSPFLPALSVPVPMPRVVTSAGTALDRSTAELTPPATAASTGAWNGTAVRPASETSSRSSMPGVLLVLATWVAGALVTLAVLALAFVRACHLVEAARPVASRHHQALAAELARAAGLVRPVRLLVSPSITIPLSFGFGRASILVPIEVGEWSDERFRAVLAHELAHLRRNDGPIQFLAQLACAIHWFHPLAWLALWRLRCERERACDDAVLLGGARPSEYASHLLAIASAPGRFDPTALATIGMARPGELEGRLLRILDPRRARRAGRGSVIGATAGVVLLAGVAAVLRPATGAVVETSAPVVVAAPAPPTPVAAAAVAASPSPVAATSPVPPVPFVAPTRPSRARVDAWLIDLADPDPRVRKEAAFRLGETRDRRATSPLIAALADPDPMVRHEAAFALGNRGYAAAVDPLVAALADPSPDVRHEAAFALGNIGDPAAVDGLVAALADPEESVRKEAAFALGVIGDARAVPALTKALASRSPKVRHEAAWALDQIERADPDPSDR